MQRQGLQHQRGHKNYMHDKPVQPHWKLCQYPEEYQYSSAKFYEKGIDEFVFLSHYLV
ncbi:MAG: hypothetical protein WKG06_45745 [Segetibacter sp.]